MRRIDVLVLAQTFTFSHAHYHLSAYHTTHASGSYKQVPIRHGTIHSAVVGRDGVLELGPSSPIMDLEDAEML